MSGLGLGLGFEFIYVPSGGDATPGGATDVILLENDDGLLLEDGTSFFTLE
jgi:hypothetical protein